MGPNDQGRDSGRTLVARLPQRRRSSALLWGVPSCAAVGYSFAGMIVSDLAARPFEAG